jgi:hypothetical protein
LTGGYGLLNSLSRLSTVQMTPAHWSFGDAMWSTWNPKPDASTSFETFLSMMMDACSSQATGMVLGWCAGDSILSIADAGVRAQCEKTVWQLLGSRFTTYEIGLVVAYALNYLIGFIKNQRTLDIIAGTGKPSEDPTLSIADIRVPPVWWTVLSLGSWLDLGLWFTSCCRIVIGFNAVQSDADAAEGRRRIRAKRFSNSCGDR